MRTIVVPNKDYGAIEAGKQLTLKGYSSGLFNGDRVRVIKRDMCQHEGVVGRIVGVEHEMNGAGYVRTTHRLEKDD